MRTEVVKPLSAVSMRWKGTEGNEARDVLRTTNDRAWMGQLPLLVMAAGDEVLEFRKIAY